MAATFVHAHAPAYSGGSPTQWLLSLGGVAAVGDLAVVTCFLGSGNPSGDTAATPSGSGWSLLFNSGSGINWDTRARVWAKLLDAGDISANQVTVTIADGAPWSAAVSVWRSAALPPAASGNWQAGTPAVFPSSPVGADGDLYLAWIGHMDPQSGAFPAPSGWTEVFNTYASGRSQGQWFLAHDLADSPAAPPSIAVSANQNRTVLIRVPLGSVSATATPSAQTGGLSVGSATVKVGATARPGAGAPGMSWPAPTLRVSAVASTPLVTLGAAVVTTSATASSVTTPPVLSRSVAVLAPAVVIGAARTPTVATAALTVPAPSVVAGIVAQPGLLSVAAGPRPTGIALDSTASPNSLSAATTVSAPTPSSVADHTVTPPVRTAAISVSAPTPGVSSSDGAEPVVIGVGVTVLSPTLIADSPPVVADAVVLTVGVGLDRPVIPAWVTAPAAVMTATTETSGVPWIEYPSTHPVGKRKVSVWAHPHRRRRFFYPQRHGH